MTTNHEIATYLGGLIEKAEQEILVIGHSQERVKEECERIDGLMEWLDYSETKKRALLERLAAQVSRPHIVQGMQNAQQQHLAQLQQRQQQTKIAERETRIPGESPADQMQRELIDGVREYSQKLRQRMVG